MSAVKANNTTDKVRQLQHRLYLAAKANSKRRFHALYDKIYREDIIKEAWKRVKSKKGAGGIDRKTVHDIEIYGIERFLQEITNELETGTYRPQPVRRSYIPKQDGNGGKRPLGIPTVKDRVVQMAAKIVIEPIFEADFLNCSYGFRPKRRQHQALEVIRKETKNKGYWVIDVDIKDYFGSINHQKLMILVEQRVTDRRVQKLIRQWLTAGIMEEGELYSSEIGAPQGGVISPLLSNIYLHYFDNQWEKHCKHLGRLVRFADDLVIISRSRKEANHAFKVVDAIMTRLELTLHPEKTKLIEIWDGKSGFDFLGFHHRFRYSRTKKGVRYKETHQYPSKKAMQKMKQKFKEVFSRGNLQQDIAAIIKTLNLKIVGMRNYYGLKKAYSQLNKIDNYILIKFTIWVNQKKQRKPRHGYVTEVAKTVYGMGLKKLAA